MTSLFTLLLMAVITSNLLILLSVIILGNKKLMITMGYSVLLLITFLVILRLVLPIEFPFTVTLRFPDILSSIIGYIRHPFMVIGSMKLSVWSIIASIWFAGAIICLIRYFVHYYRMTASLSACNSLSYIEPFHSILKEIYEGKNIRKRFRIVLSKTDMPCLFGIFKPYILIPENMINKLTADEMYFILCHEISHHIHHDLLIKMLINVISCVYWWNPAAWMLRRQSDIILDMRVDRHLTLDDNRTKAAYMGCLVNLIKCRNKDNKHSKYTVSICKNIDYVTKRFEVMTNDNKWNMLKMVFPIIAALILFVLSYCFVFEAHFYIDEVQEAVDKYKTMTFYAVINENGLYDIYLDDFYLETVDSLDKFPVDIIYNKKGELVNEPQIIKEN